jgi:DNA-binding transcriptional MerR regulator
VDYRIDELARAGNTTVRNVRAYQERGLLPPPRREGRVGLYSESHLARLRVINALLERGYSLGNIAELLETWEAGGDLRELLGFEQAVLSPFVDEPEGTIALDELAKLFDTIDPLAIAKAVKLGLLIPEETQFRVPSMRLLRAGAELHRSGIPLSALLDELAALRDNVDQIAERFVALVQRHVFDKYGDALPPPSETAKLTDMVQRVRPLASLVVDTELGHALERHIRAGLGDRLVRLLDRKKKKSSAR